MTIVKAHPTLEIIAMQFFEMKKKVGDQNTSKKDKKSDNGMIISYLNCYAAGIFFATCILHMLPEISEKMKNEIMKGNA